LNTPRIAAGFQDKNVEVECVENKNVEVECVEKIEL